MSTIAKEFTKEQLIEKLQHRIAVAAKYPDLEEAQLDAAIFKIALASLEAEPVGEVSEQRDGLVMDGTVDLGGASTHRIIKGASKMKRLPLGTKFYTTPPAPANAEPVAWLWSHRKHPSEVSLVRPEDDERAEGAHWSGWSCQALYAAPPAPVSVPDEVCWEDVPEEITEDDMALASAWAHGFNQCRAAMLKHSEPFIVTSDHRMMEMPQVEAINAVTAMLQGVENAETPTTMQTAPALDSSPKIAELPSGNSPVIPDGWVLVPEEPTHEMLEAGDEQFGTYDVYRRMIAASPQQEVK
ncbi:hypothetical protein [Enterobacter kobei]|uniref:hypothetical protein n=1 Tax=Enterobacter kobei TaxID=208224 RepID=UPI0039C400ED